MAYIYSYTIQLLSVSPTPSDSHAKERVDVNKLVHELIGETLSPPSRLTDSSPHKSPQTPVLDVSSEIPTPTSSRRKPVRLVVDTLAPINIKPRVRSMFSNNLCMCTVTCTYSLTLPSPLPLPPPSPLLLHTH